MLRFAVGALLPLAVGLPFTLWLQSWLARLAMGFLAGMVVLTAGLTAIGAAGFRFGPASLAPLALVWLVAATLAVRRTWPSIGSWPSWPAGWGWAAWVLLALTALNVATAAAYAFRVPISDTDVVVIWFPKAILIATRGFLALGQSVYPDYPPLWPLHIFLANGGAPWLKLLPSAYLVATLMLAFAYVRSKTGPTMAAACTLAISAVPYIWLPYGVNDLMSEIPTMAFVTASTLMLAEYVDQPSAARAALTSVAAVGTVWVRPEGFFHAFLVGTILVVAGFRIRRLRETVLPAGAILVAYLAWRFVVRFVFHYVGGLQANLAALTPSALASTLSEIVRYAATNAGNPYLFGPALIAVACIALGMAKWRSFAIVGLVLAVDLAIGVATYAALPTTDVGEPLIWWLTTGFKRMLIHVTPLLYVTAILAVGWLFARFAARGRDEPPAAKRGESRTGVVMPLATVLVASLLIAVAAYAAYRVGGPKTYDLSEMGPSHVGGATPDFSTPGTILLSTHADSGSQLIYYLQIAGRRLPPLDNISGTFSRFSTAVEAFGSDSGPATFRVTADGRVIASVTTTPGSRPAALSGAIPIGTRFLELDVSQRGTGSGTASWIQPTVQRVSFWWLTDTLLLLALALAATLGLVASGVIGLHDQRLVRWLTPAGLAILLVAAAAVQLAEAMFEVAVPVWSGAIELVMHHL